MNENTNQENNAFSETVNEESDNNSVHVNQDGQHQDGEEDKSGAGNESNISSGYDDNSEDGKYSQKTDLNTQRDAEAEVAYHDDDKDDAGHEEHEEEQEEGFDYSTFSKEDLKQRFQEIKKEYKSISPLYHALKEIRSYIDDVYNEEKDEALKKFLEEGGDEGDFDFKSDEFFNQFYSYFNKIKKEYKNHIEELNRQKEENRKRREQILDRLRELIDGEETQASFDEIRELQKEWKNIGQVPPAYVKTLWDNYNALMERYYNQRSIFQELKNLDRKKNLESKLELCEKAEKLTEKESLKEALSELDKIHSDFKNTGPVPNDRKEEVWNRLKAATDKIYDWKRSYIEEVKRKQEENLKVKQEILEKAEALASFQSESIDEWKKKADEAQALQNEWKSAGHVSKEKAKEINKKFWAFIKDFFRNKNEFFKKLQEERKENLKKKEELCQKAENLKDSNDFDNTAKELMDLQKQWKEIGPVPFKKKDKIYQRFKAACDEFFERKRAQKAEEEKENKQLLDKKYELCQKLENAGNDDFNSIDKLEEIENEWVQTGYVPYKEAGEVQKRFIKALKKKLEQLNVDAGEREKHILNIQVQSIKNAPQSDKELDKKRKNIRDKIKELENNINLWQNNIGFFSGATNSNNSQASQLVQDYMKKIEDARSEVEELKEQLKVINKEMKSGN